MHRNELVTGVAQTAGIPRNQGREGPRRAGRRRHRGRAQGRQGLADRSAQHRARAAGTAHRTQPADRCAPLHSGRLLRPAVLRKPPQGRGPRRPPHALLTPRPSREPGLSITRSRWTRRTDERVVVGPCWSSACLHPLSGSLTWRLLPVVRYAATPTRVRSRARTDGSRRSRNPVRLRSRAGHDVEAWTPKRDRGHECRVQAPRYLYQPSSPDHWHLQQQHRPRQNASSRSPAVV